MNQGTCAHASRVKPGILRFREGSLDWSRPYVMGVLNTTPDSFSDGGRLPALTAAIDAAARMVVEGADLLDIGGESTRPGAQSVSELEECERVLPLLEALRRIGVPLSVDTTKAVVARQAVAAGAQIVNDVSGGRFDEGMIGVVESLGVVFVCGHVQGETLAQAHKAQLSAEAVVDELAARVASLPAALRSRTIADPCIGFGKQLETNLALLRVPDELLARTGCPVLLGPSRKRFLGELTGLSTDKLDPATVGACLAGAASGAHIVRVHNVAITASALRVYCAAQEAA